MITRRYLIVGLVSLFVLCCNKKESDIEVADVAVNLINAVAGNGNTDLNMNFTGDNITYANAKKLSYWAWDGASANGVMVMGVPASKAVPLIVTLARDTTKPIFNQSFTFNAGDVYSLFIGGKVESPTYIMIKDSLTTIVDSVTALRFINMAQDINSVSINLAGNAIGSEVNQLSYKQVTDFKFYSSRSQNFIYKFEFHDRESGNLIATFDYNNIANQKHVTLILRGLKDSYPSLEVVRMNNW